MANIFNPRAVADTYREQAMLESYNDLLDSHDTAVDQVVQLQEGMSELIRFIEDRDWVPLAGYQKVSGFELATVKTNSDNARALLSVNPVIKKAVNARIGYVWGKGVVISGTNGTDKALIDPGNKDQFFSSIAHEELERVLATDGNVFAIRNKRRGIFHIVPIDQITGTVTDSVNPTKVNFYCREYIIETEDFVNGGVTTETVKEFIPTAGLVFSIREIQGIPISRDWEMVHRKVNAQKGWLWGIPDIMAAMFWAQAHKELFESGVTYVKAQGRFASKVVSATSKGATNTAATLRDTPRRDEASGQVLDTGNTAVMGAGMDMQLMGKMTGGVDFKTFDRVAALIAIGLDVPIQVLLGDAQEDLDLDESVVMAMTSRQNLWKDFYEALLGPARKPEIKFPVIKTVPLYRMVQSLGLTNELNVLSRVELRKLTLEAYQMEGDPNALPPEPVVQPTGVTPAQGVAGVVGKLDDGNHQLRDANQQAHYTPQK